VKLCSREFECGVLRKIFGPKREVVAGDWKNFVLKSCMVCTPHQILFRSSNQEG
jgi:hypothetical protein